jgi:hypothetical protein
LVSARVLTGLGVLGEGTSSRDLGWEDYQQFPWNYPVSPKGELKMGDINPLEPDSLLRGFSTTRLLTISPDQFPRLAVQENLELLRIEAVRNNSPQPRSETAYLVHRIFIIARGYTLGEILRQLGGRPRDPLRSVHRELLQFQPLAQPNYFRWSQVQKALFNINRFAFRLATGEADPLGLLASPDAWRLFLLHHWDFIDADDVAPSSCPKKYRYSKLAVTTTEIKKHVIDTWYPDQVLPSDWYSTLEGRQTYLEASAYCKQQLQPLVERWEKLKRLIEQAQQYPEHAAENRVSLRRLGSPRSFDVPREWYPQLIHRDDAEGKEHRERWFALMQEGYLISRPAPRRGWRRIARLIKPYSINDIPGDPRVLEPFVMRTRFYLAKAKLDLAEAKVDSAKVEFDLARMSE